MRRGKVETHSSVAASNTVSGMVGSGREGQRGRRIFRRAPAVWKGREGSRDKSFVHHRAAGRRAGRR